MRIINVITTQYGIISSIESFPVLSPDAMNQNENNAQEEAAKQSFLESVQEIWDENYDNDLESIYRAGEFDNQSGRSVLLTDSDVVTEYEEYTK